MSDTFIFRTTAAKGTDVAMEQLEIAHVGMRDGDDRPTEEVASYYNTIALDPGFAGGVFVAAGDLD